MDTHDASGAFEAGQVAPSESARTGRVHRRPRRDNASKTAQVVLVCACLALLIATGLFIGVPVLSVPPLIGSNEGKRPPELRTGRILLPTDETNCRQMLFDNYTGILREGAIGPCSSRPSDVRRMGNGFTWGRQ
jgi:hypothetical protein